MSVEDDLQERRLALVNSYKEVTKELIKDIQLSSEAQNEEVFQFYVKEIDHLNEKRLTLESKVKEITALGIKTKLSLLSGNFRFEPNNIEVTDEFPSLKFNVFDIDGNEVQDKKLMINDFGLQITYEYSNNDNSYIETKREGEFNSMITGNSICILVNGENMIKIGFEGYCPYLRHSTNFGFDNKRPMTLTIYHPDGYSGVEYYVIECNEGHKFH